MEATTKRERPAGRRLTMTKAAVIPLFIAAFITLGLTAGKKILPGVSDNAVGKDSFVQPAACRLVLAPLPGTNSIDDEIGRQQALILKGSSPANGLERLGWSFVKKARLSFDAGFYKLAEQCAACMEARGLKGPDALLLRAHALQSLHRFAEAESVARALVSQRERPFDYGVLGDILIDQGKLREGAAAYQRMVDLRPDLQSYSRAAHVRWLTGDLAGAIELMNLATRAASPNDPEAAAWAFTRLALYQLQTGATKQALDSCTAALSLQRDYAPAMLARSRTLLAMDRVADAVVELKRAVNLNPLPEYKWTLADALISAGNRAEAAEIESQIGERSAGEEPRTVSLYLATRGREVERAIRLARQELANRNDVFTHDAVAWALAAAGRVTEAQQHITHALSEGTADPRLYLHAGVIAALNHDHKSARRWLAKAATAQQMLLPSERMQLAAWRATPSEFNLRPIFEFCAKLKRTKE
ncbi:MAG TPA: tetratricopeptide repeat protein [Pyrinomonadaceae bacterium]|nr:tetratricopeptide repeat protein [Pyrinomonadaceae bacterium]